MIKYYKTIEGKMTSLDDYQAGCWISVAAPEKDETAELISRFGVDAGYINAALDEEESARIEKDGDSTLIILDTPMIEQKDDNFIYYTMPLGIIVSKEHIITITTVQNPLIEDLRESRIKELNTEFRTKFVLLMMLRTASRFLQHLKQIDKKSNLIERQLRKSMKNKELIQLLELQKSLVYFNTSLASDTITVKKVANGRFIKMFDEDQDLLQDVIIELNQAQEMASIYLNILSGTMDAFASVISNNLNIVMKILASITVVISIPTIISSFYGMNVSGIPVPSFWFPIVLSLAAMGICVWILNKKNMF